MSGPGFADHRLLPWPLQVERSESFNLEYKCATISVEIVNALSISVGPVHIMHDRLGLLQCSGRVPCDHVAFVTLLGRQVVSTSDRVDIWIERGTQSSQSTPRYSVTCVAR